MAGKSVMHCQETTRETRSAYSEILVHPLHDFIAGEQQCDDREGHIEDAEDLPRIRFGVYISVADRRDRHRQEVQRDRHVHLPRVSHEINRREEEDEKEKPEALFEAPNFVLRLRLPLLRALALGHHQPPAQRRQRPPDALRGRRVCPLDQRVHRQRHAAHLVHQRRPLILFGAEKLVSKVPFNHVDDFLKFS